VALGILLALAAGCGSEDAPAPTVPTPPAPPPVAPPPDTLDLPDDPEVVFLEIWQLPGFVPIEFALGRPPQYVVTVGGDVYYEGPTIAIFPGPLLPNIQRGEFSTEDLEAVIAATAATGVSQVVTEENIGQPATGPIIADAPTYEVLLRDRQGSHVLRIEAPGAGSHTDPRVTAVRDLMELLDRSSASVATEPYEGDRVQVYASIGPMHPDPSVLNERPWPLPDPPPGDGEGGFECRVYDGQIASGLLAVLVEANHGTRWDYRGTLHQLLARSLLPHEEPCVR
jgi:hypothetical protein